MEWVKKQIRYRFLRNLYVRKYHSLKVNTVDERSSGLFTILPIFALQVCPNYITQATLFKPLYLWVYFLLILSRVLYICPTFNLTRECCVDERMVQLIKSLLSIVSKTFIVFQINLARNYCGRDHYRQLFLYRQSRVSLKLAMGLSLWRSYGTWISH